MYNWTPRSSPVEEVLIWLLNSVEPLRSEAPSEMEAPALRLVDCSYWRSWEGGGSEADEEESKTTNLSCAYFARTRAHVSGG